MPPTRQETVKAGIATLSCGDSVLGRRNPAARKRWRWHVRSDIHRADGGDLRRTRPGSEVGRGTVSYENVVGLVLSILLALFLFAALLFPERF